MAITLIQGPGDLAAGLTTGFSFHSPLWHVLTSTNVNLPGFRFVIDVLIGSDTIRLKIAPDASGYGTFDVSHIVRAYAENYFFPHDLSFGFATINTDKIVVNYTVLYGEEYVGSPLPYVSSASSTHYAYNAYNTPTPGGSPFEPMIGVLSNWATSRDITDIRVPEGGNAFLSYINDPHDTIQIMLQELDADGAPVGIVYTSGSFNTIKKLLVLRLVPGYLREAFGPGIVPIPPGAAGFRVAIKVPAIFTQTDWANVRWLCEPKTPATPLHFLNRFGAFDTFHFTGPTRRELAVEGRTSQHIPMVSTAGVVREYEPSSLVYADTVRQHNTRQTWTRKLSSGYVDDRTHEGLWQLIASPQIYLEENGFYYPVILNTKKWSERRTRFDKMYNLDLEISVGRQVFSQSR